MNKRIAEHIKIELICAVFFSLFIGIIGFGILFFTGQGVLSKTVYGQAFTEQMENQQFSKLQDYVKKNRYLWIIYKGLMHGAAAEKKYI